MKDIKNLATNAFLGFGSVKNGSRLRQNVQKKHSAGPKRSKTGFFIGSNPDWLIFLGRGSYAENRWIFLRGWGSAQVWFKISAIFSIPWMSLKEKFICVFRQHRVCFSQRWRFVKLLSCTVWIAGKTRRVHASLLTSYYALLLLWRHFIPTFIWFCNVHAPPTSCLPKNVHFFTFNSDLSLFTYSPCALNHFLRISVGEGDFVVCDLLCTTSYLQAISFLLFTPVEELLF